MNNICPECKTENEPEYQYCKNCGTPLIAEQNKTYTDYSGAETSAQGVNTIDGVPVQDVITFTGKNAQKIVPAFIKMQSTGSKVSWCWPAFIFGLFFGPIGVAIWFLYRKMYKVASAFAGIGVFVNYAAFVLDRVFRIGASAEQTLEEYLESFLSNSINYGELISALTNKQSVLSYVVSSANSTISIACAVLGGVFAMYLYKQHTVKSILNIKSQPIDTAFGNFTLAAKGGTSVGAVIIGLIVISLLSNIPNIIYDIIKTVEGAIIL